MKYVSKSLTGLQDHSIMRMLLDPYECVDTVAAALMEDWAMDLYTRKPGPAVDANGEFVGTDLDLATFMSALAARGAVIRIPEYQSMRARTIREGERVKKGEDRNGKILTMYANQDAFSFGVKIIDRAVTSLDEHNRAQEGAPRNFTLVDVRGDWHKGWRKVYFTPSMEENDFLTRNKLWTGNTLVVKHFVHPNRWISFYGQPYFLTKAMIQRLEEEASWLRGEIKSMKASGMVYESTGTDKQKEWPTSSEVGESKSLKVNAFQCEVDLPPHDWSDFSRFSERPGGLPHAEGSRPWLEAATNRQRNISHTLLPMLRFATRAVELVFFKKFGEDLPTFPAWIRDAKWEDKYREKGKRTDWRRLVLFQPGVGEQGVALRYRVYEKSERVAAEALAA